MDRSRCSSHLDRRHCSKSIGTGELKGLLKIPVACNFGRMVTGRNDVSSPSSFAFLPHRRGLSQRTADTKGLRHTHQTSVCYLSPET